MIPTPNSTSTNSGWSDPVRSRIAWCGSRRSCSRPARRSTASASRATSRFPSARRTSPPRPSSKPPSGASPLPFDAQFAPHDQRRRGDLLRTRPIGDKVAGGRPQRFARGRVSDAAAGQQREHCRAFAFLQFEPYDIACPRRMRGGFCAETHSTRGAGPVLRDEAAERQRRRRDRSGVAGSATTRPWLVAARCARASTRCTATP